MRRRREGRRGAEGEEWRVGRRRRESKMKRDRWVASNKAILCKNMGQHSTQHCIGGREGEGERGRERESGRARGRIKRESKLGDSSKALGGNEGGQCN